MLGFKCISAFIKYVPESVIEKTPVALSNDPNVKDGKSEFPTQDRLAALTAWLLEDTNVYSEIVWPSVIPSTDAGVTNGITPDRGAYTSLIVKL